MIAGQRMAAIAFAFLALAPSTLGAQTSERATEAVHEAAVWEVDANHSQIGFSVRHFFTPVEGHFADYEVELSFDPETPEDGHVDVRIDASSVDTDNDRRDADLRGSSFFEVERFPELAFESTGIDRVSETEFVVHGDLTIRDVTRPIDLAVTLLGMRELEGDVEHNDRMIAGFQAEAMIDRRDFGVGSGRWAETVVLGPEVTIGILVETRLR